MPSATPKPTGTALGGWLVFESRRQDTNGDGLIDSQDGIHLYKLDLSTRESIQLTSGLHRDRYPSWSPDGCRIVFASNRQGNYDLYVIDANGSGLLRLTDTPDDEVMPEWSPDGSQIAYVVFRRLASGKQEEHIHVLSLESGATEPLLTNPPLSDFDPHYSPDGRFLAFIWRTEVVEGGTSVWRDTVALWDMRVGVYAELKPPGMPEGVTVTAPRWLPSGNLLSLARSHGENPMSLEVFEVRWEDQQPALSQVFSIADFSGWYVWGPGNDWLVAEIINQSVTAETPAEYDLVSLPVDFSTQKPPFDQCYYSLFFESERLTDNAFYDGWPDWTPGEDCPG